MPASHVAIRGRHPRHRRLLIVQEHFERLVGPPQQRDHAAVGARGAASTRRPPPARRSAAGLRAVSANPTAKHGDAFRMQRGIDLRHDHRDQVARIGFVWHASRERHQDLARVVLVAEEALIEPPLRRVAIPQGEAQHRQEEEIEQRPSSHDHRERLVALLHERRHQRDHRDQHERGERAPREGVLQALPQHRARAEHVTHRHRVRQAERRQQHDRLQERFDRPRQHDRPAQQVRSTAGCRSSARRQTPPARR